MRGWLLATLASALSLLSVHGWSEPSLTSTPEWQLLKDSLRGIGLSLEGVETSFGSLSDYFKSERLNLEKGWQNLNAEKESFEKQKASLEERGRLYDYLKKEADDLKRELDKAYSRGIVWAGICGGVGLAAGLVIGGLLR